MTREYKMCSNAEELHKGTVCFTMDTYILHLSIMSEEKTPKKAAENADKQKKKSPETREKANNTAEKKLKETTIKPEKKKEKQWRVSTGTTEVETEDRSMNISTTGLKFENKKKNLELTVGAATISETEKPGSFPTQKILPGFSFTRKF